MQIIVT